MNMTIKNGIYREHLSQWLKAKKDKRKRSEIIDHICFVAGVHRKSVPRSFRRLQMRSGSDQERRGREIFYTNDVIAALKDIWNIASEPCGENLYGVLADYVQILKRDGNWNHSDQTTEKLLMMSLGTMKKRVAKFSRKQFVSHGKSTTKAGAIHSLIPVRSGD